MASSQQLLDIASGDLGVTEDPPNSNRTVFGERYGWNGVFWCAIWVWDVARRAGVELPMKTASVYMLMNAYKAADRFYSSPQPGDLAIFKFGTGHIGFVETVPMDGRTIVTLEGNTSPTDAGSQNNGGCVARRRRKRNSLILGYCRPSYGSAAAMPSQPPAQQGDAMPDTFMVNNDHGPGYWVVRTRDGGVYAEDGAQFFGSMSGKRINAPIVALAPHVTASTVDGYWLFGQDGGAYGFGQAKVPDSYAGHPEWHKGSRYVVGGRQLGDGYELITIEINTDPPRPNKYDLSAKR